MYLLFQDQRRTAKTTNQIYIQQIEEIIDKLRKTKNNLSFFPNQPIFPIPFD